MLVGFYVYHFIKNIGPTVCGCNLIFEKIRAALLWYKIAGNTEIPRG